ncbi:hypothetical protein ACG2F4_07345 [Halalkalibaculum sp. DA3122]|uniref:hypothetical protein n=1 Tax=Halalkalibaculum sp. DA3122 TaxID=3373607 RepID=UPI003754293B
MKYYYPLKSSTIQIVKISSILITGILVLLSFLYLFTYYSFFEVNIFSYISINTIISYSIESIGFVILTCISGYAVILLYDYVLANIFKFFSQIVYKYSLQEHKLKLVLLGIPFLAVVGLIWYLFNFYSVDLIFQDEKLNILVKEAFAIFLFMGVYLFASNSERVTLNPSQFSFKKICISLVLITSILTISKALLDVIYFYDNSEYRYVLPSDLKGDYPDEKLKLIGKADDHYFLKHPEKKPVIVKKYEDFKRLHIYTFKDTTDAK